MSEPFLPVNTPLKSRCLTINTDASVCPDTKAGGYAFWSVCDVFVFKKSGQLDGDIDGSTEAEIKAIAYALHAILKRDDLPQITLLVINTDSKGSISAIVNRKGEVAQLTAKLLDKLSLVTQAQKIELRHVKAHTGTKDARSKVNEWCDREAKRKMILGRTQRRLTIKKQNGNN